MHWVLQGGILVLILHSTVLLKKGLDRILHVLGQTLCTAPFPLCCPGVRVCGRHSGTASGTYAILPAAPRRMRMEVWQKHSEI